jgi:hypothetical protein
MADKKATQMSAVQWQNFAGNSDFVDFEKNKENKSH